MVTFAPLVVARNCNTDILECDPTVVISSKLYGAEYMYSPKTIAI
jgi:hypothetical protein